MLLAFAFGGTRLFFRGDFLQVIGSAGGEQFIRQGGGVIVFLVIVVHRHQPDHGGVSGGRRGVDGGLIFGDGGGPLLVHRGDHAQGLVRFGSQVLLDSIPLSAFGNRNPFENLGRPSNVSLAIRFLPFLHLGLLRRMELADA